MSGSEADILARKHLARALKQARLVSEHKQEPINVGCVIVELAQASELELQLGEGTYELLADDYFQRLDQFAGKHDDVVRLGSNRALVVLRGLTGQDHLDLAAAKLNRVTSPPILVVNNSVLVKTNAGLALTRAGDMDSEQLYNASMSALARANADQRFVVYDPRSIDQDADRWQLRVELEQALHQGELFPYFEPVMTTAYGAVSGAAAQMIWHSPKRGALPFEKVSQAATDADLTRPLTWHFIKSVIGQAAHWDRSISTLIPLAPCVLRDNEVIQEIEDALAIYEIDAARITVEVDEQTMADEVARRVLADLRSRKMRVRVHHMGNGGLPLAALTDLPVDELTFAPAITGKQTPPKLKQAIFQLFRTAGVDLVALNVKDARIAQRYKELGFSSVQGPVVGSVMRADEFTRWLKVKVGAVG